MLQLKVNTDAAYVAMAGQNAQRQLRGLEQEEKFRARVMKSYNTNPSASSVKINKSDPVQYNVVHAYEHHKDELRKNRKQKEQDHRADVIKQRVQKEFERERRKMESSKPAKTVRFSEPDTQQRNNGGGGITVIDNSGRSYSVCGAHS